uniref:F-box domain-containing protein n=1 Tax=Glossina austeni TaxID=7395 RepID=A0A1A9VCB8_GLOAU
MTLAKNLFDLNDDCLLEVFQYLNGAEQNRVRKLCTRFEGIVQQFWKKKKHLQLSVNIVNVNFEKSLPDFEDYLAAVSDIIIDVEFVCEVFNFNNCMTESSRQLTNVLQKFKFSNARSLSFSAFKEDIVLLKSFPNLRKLRLILFERLLSPPQVMSYFHTCQLDGIGLCKHLEELYMHPVSVHLYPTFIASIAQMRNLRLILCMQQDSKFFIDLTKILKDRIYSFAGPFYMINKSCTVNDLKILAVFLGKEEQRFQLLNLIKACKVLEVLEIYGIELGIRFLSKMEDILTNTRTSGQPLRVKYISRQVYVDITRRNYNSLPIVKNSSYMDFSIEARGGIPDVSLSFKIEFKPLSDLSE